MSLTIACLYVRGHVPFTVDYVARLYMMCRRHVGRHFRFVCLTDRPEEMPFFVEPICITPFDGVKAWWNKIRLFDPALGLRGRCLYLDLDTLIVAPLREIVDYRSAFALAPHAGDFNGTARLKVVKRYNSSVMVWDAGLNSGLFHRWAPDVAGRLFGDQDWIGEQWPGATAMPLDWFPRISEVRPPFPREAKVILVKKPKNHVAAQQWPWFREMWTDHEARNVAN